MNDQLSGRGAEPGVWQIAAAMRQPPILFLLAANSIPIFGVLAWGWDVFVLLVLYWLETAIIGVWMVARVAIAPAGSMDPKTADGSQKKTPSLFLAGFFVMHAGIFMAVHMVFLWTLFSGEWPKVVHGPADFFSKLVVATDMWIPLLVLFVVRGLIFLFDAMWPENQNAAQSGTLVGSSGAPIPSGEEIGSIVGGFYARIFVMHLTILLSAFVAVIFESIAPLIVMVAMKTLTDAALQLKFDVGKARTKTAVAPSTVSMP
jgi:Family of unknown function (DUF6498)